MIARATLALMLAGPALMGGLVTASHPAAAYSRRPTVLPPSVPPRERTTQSAPRRGRAVLAAFNHRQTRREAPATVAMFDDGLAYDTPRDAQGRPLANRALVSNAVFQTGTASWYGGEAWQGHRMSDGSRYDQDRLTAAHATLPLGSKVLVTLADSSRSVVVTITDRPGTRSRIIDLSRGAAVALGMTSQGVAQVSLAPQQ